jgi:hypothetical protein
LLVKECQRKKEELEQIDKEFDNLIKSTIPLQDRLGVTITKDRVMAAKQGLLLAKGVCDQLWCLY